MQMYPILLCILCSSVVHCIISYSTYQSDSILSYCVSYPILLHILSYCVSDPTAYPILLRILSYCVSYPTAYPSPSFLSILSIPSTGGNMGDSPSRCSSREV